MKPYHLRRPPWRHIYDNRACYVSELPSKPVEEWTYIIDGVHYYYYRGKYLTVNPAWTFANYELAFICTPANYTVLGISNTPLMAGHIMPYPS